MPIGKNSIKRVASNGYSAVETKAPDMENSTVLATPIPEEKIEKQTVTPPPKAQKTDAPKKKVGRPRKNPDAPTAVKKSPAKTAPKAKKAAPAAAFTYVNVGEELPIHLL